MKDDLDTPEGFKRAREALGLSQTALARILGLGGDGGRTVRKWEAPEGTTNARQRGPNPVAAQVLRWMGSPGRPREWPAHDEGPS